MDAFAQFMGLMPQKEYYCLHQLGRSLDFCKPEQIKIEKIKNEINYFFCANSVGYRWDVAEGRGRINRDGNHLNQYTALWCDIDVSLGDWDVPPTPADLWQYIKRHNIGIELPMPTMVNCSGSGLHLFWAIKALPYKGNKEKWLTAAEYIYSVLRGLGADHKATTDSVHLMRIPGTINRKDGRADKLCYNIEIHPDAIYDLSALIREYELNVIPFPSKKQTEKRKKQDKPVVKQAEIISFRFAWSVAARRTVADLIHILHNHRDREDSGRECLLYTIYYYALCASYGNEEEAERVVMEANAQLDCPLTDKELTHTRSAIKSYKCNPHGWKTDTIISFNSLTQAELADCKHIMTAAESRRRKQQRDKTRYEQQRAAEGRLSCKDEQIYRQIQVYELALRGMDNTAISRVLGVSVRTVQRDQRIINTTEWIAAYRAGIYDAIVSAKTSTEAAKTGTDTSVECPVAAVIPDRDKNSAVSIIPSFVLSVGQVCRSASSPPIRLHKRSTMTGRGAPPQPDG